MPEGSIMSDCIFCKIAHGEIPSDLLYEDDNVVAFSDLSPQAPVHVLVVPKTHYVSLLENVDDQTLVSMRRAVISVVKRFGLEERGFRCIVNTGTDAGQTVMHLHLHVLGGTPLGEGLLPDA